MPGGIRRNSLVWPGGSAVAYSPAAQVTQGTHPAACGLLPDVFIGIDAPDFNLGLEIKLRRSGIRTVHYVSPTVWAWRQRRVRKIGGPPTWFLCLFPFEPVFTRTMESAAYVGHPMADQIRRTRPGRRASDWALTRPRHVALLPGSRGSEVSRLAEPMIEAARTLDPRRTRPAICRRHGE